MTPSRTFASRVIAGDWTLAEARGTAGRANVGITSGYLHLMVIW